MTDLVEFLRQRIAEDEHKARAAQDAGRDGRGWFEEGAMTDAGFEDFDAALIASHSPARVVREVEAKRRIVERHAQCGTGSGYCDDGGHGIDGVGCPDLLDLAVPFSAEPGYKQEWAV